MGTYSGFSIQIPPHKDYSAQYSIPLSGYEVDVVLDIEEAHLYQIAEIPNLLKYNFYVDVNGRRSTFDDHPIPNYELYESSVTGQGMLENPIDIIYDLVRKELGHDAINEAEYLEARKAHNGWKFGFTINKKISSKKLIEDIAKSTKCFPKFKNDGTFGFNTIKNNWTVSDMIDEVETGDYNTAHLIKESDVISYSFKKTKPENIYQKVEVLYKKDYVEDNITKRTLPGVVVYGDGQNEINYGNFYNFPHIVLGDPRYYGIDLAAESQVEWIEYMGSIPDRISSSETETRMRYIHSNASLEFESDYIRDNTTADLLMKFLIGHHHNAHLVAKIKLPLSYINLEIGDLVKFRELFGGVKAFGIDYRIIQMPNVNYQGNGQAYFPLFMITSTTKNLDSVSIECIQLHDIDWDDHDADSQNAQVEAWLDNTIHEDGTKGLFYFADADIVGMPSFYHSPPISWGSTILKIGDDSAQIVEEAYNIASSYTREIMFNNFNVSYFEGELPEYYADVQLASHARLDSIFLPYLGGLGALGIENYNDLLPPYNGDDGTYGADGSISPGKGFRDFVALEIIFEPKSITGINVNGRVIAKLQNIYDTVWDEDYEPTLISDANPGERYISRDYVPGNPEFGNASIGGYWGNNDECDEIKLGWVIYRCDFLGVPYDLREGVSPNVSYTEQPTLGDTGNWEDGSPNIEIYTTISAYIEPTIIYISLWDGLTRHAQWGGGSAAAFGDYQLVYEFPTYSHVLDESNVFNSIQIVDGRLGDINLDGGVDALDLTELISHMDGTTLLTGQGLLNADFSQDGVINITDLQQIANYILDLDPDGGGGS